MLEGESVDEPGYIERSISAPPLSYGGFQDFLPSGGVPSRSNPRVPKAVKNSQISPVLEGHDDAYLLEGFNGLSVLDEDSHVSHIKSLVVDAKPKTPFDLIQADFPSTPSAVFASKYGDDNSSQQGHHIDETDELDDVLTGVDQTTLSMPDMYATEEDEYTSQQSNHSTGSHSYANAMSAAGNDPVQQQHYQYPQNQMHQQQMQHQQMQGGFVPQAQPFQPAYMTGQGYGGYQQQQMSQNIYSQQYAPHQQMAQQIPNQQTMGGYGNGMPTQGGYGMGMNHQGGGIYQPGNMAMPGNGFNAMQTGGYMMQQDGILSMGMLDATGRQHHGQQQQQSGYFMNGMSNQMAGGMVANQQQGMYMDPYYRMGMPGSNGGYMQSPQQQQPEVGYSNPSNGGDGMTFMPYGQQQLSGAAPYWTPQNSQQTQHQTAMMYQQQPNQFGQPSQGMMMGPTGAMGMPPQNVGGRGVAGSYTMQQTVQQQQLSDNGMSINAPPYVHSSPMRTNGVSTNMQSPTKPHNSSLGGSGEFGDSLSGGLSIGVDHSVVAPMMSIASPVREAHMSGSMMGDPMSPGGNMHGGRGMGDRRGGGRGGQHGANVVSGGRGGMVAGNTAAVNAGASRDPVVDDFRNTYGKGRQWEINDLIGHVVPFCQDQHGSRFIQQRLEVASDADKQVVFDEVLPNAHSLMTDVFGNYVIQKLFEFGTPDQCETLAALLMGQAVPLAMQMYGCRVIQKALEYVQTQRLIALVGEFEGQQVLRCVHDQNGNHVIQKCIEVVSRVAKENSPESEYLSSRIQFIIQAFQGRVKELSMHPYGCRVVQRILEHCSNTQKAPVLEELRKCCRELIQDQYGNYVIQHVMQHGWETDRAILIREVQSRLLDYSQHKFASNVVEKCIQFADRRDRDEMIWTIIKVTFDLNNPVDAKTGQCVLENMVRDPYANYVVQKVIDVSNEAQRGAIIRYVRENIVQLRRYTYGKHIIVRLEKVSGEKF